MYDRYDMTCMIHMKDTMKHGKGSACPKAPQLSGLATCHKIEQHLRHGLNTGIHVPIKTLGKYVIIYIYIFIMCRLIYTNSTEQDLINEGRLYM